MKIKELRLLNIKIIQGEDVIYEGMTEDIPENLKNMEYNQICFEGTNVVIRTGDIWQHFEILVNNNLWRGLKYVK